MTGIEPELKALMLQGLDGDAAAHSRLLDAMSGYLRAYFRRRLGANAPELEDLVQDALLAIHVKRHTFDREMPFTPWAYALARYRLLDHFRQARRRPTLPIDGVGALFAEENAEEGAVRRDVEILLARLPDGQRALMRDVKLSGLSMDEAGGKRGMSAASVRVSIHRGLQALMKGVRDEDR